MVSVWDVKAGSEKRVDRLGSWSQAGKHRLQLGATGFARASDFGHSPLQSELDGRAQVRTMSLHRPVCG
jgi:hypothetical protein